MSNSNSKAVALQILSLLNEAGDVGKSGTQIPPEQAMEILTGVMLSVVTVGGITGTSTNGEFTLRIEKGDTTATEVCGECGRTECICTKH
jgi:hypothetical protein